MIDRTRLFVSLGMLSLLCLAGCSGSSGPYKADVGNKAHDTWHATDQPLIADTARKDGVTGTVDKKLGDGSTTLTEAAATGCKPYCYPKGSKSQGWYDGCTKKILNLPGTNEPYYDSCDNCTVECRTTPAQGWYSSCTNQLIIMGCN